MGCIHDTISTMQFEYAVDIRIVVEVEAITLHLAALGRIRQWCGKAVASHKCLTVPVGEIL